jgi:cytochrome c oxidase subunit 1
MQGAAKNGRSRALWRWLEATEAETIAVRFQVGTLALFFVGTTLAVLVRIEHLSPRPTILQPDAFYRVLTLHGLVMLFWVALPALSAGLGMARLPVLLGIQNLVWPRLGRAAFFAWVVGTGCLLCSVLAGVPDGGFMLRPPLSTDGGWASPLAALGVAWVALSSTVLALSQLATLRRHRTRDRSFLDGPLLVTSLACSAALTLLAAPVLMVTMLLLFLERATGFGFFEPAHGGSPDLYARLFWLSARPAVVAALLPALGVSAELLPDRTGQPLRGRRSMTAAVMALAALSLVGAGEHWLTAGPSTLTAAVSSAFGMLLALPLGVVALGLLVTVGRARLEWDAPLVHALGVVWFLWLGLLSGLVASAMSVNVYLHGTAFVVGHLHCLTLGALTNGWFAGLIHGWSQSYGRRPDRRQARTGAVLALVGGNVTVLPLFVLGARGLVRGSYDYVEEFRALEIVSTVGAWVYSSGLLISLYSLGSTWFRPRERLPHSVLAVAPQHRHEIDP